jgi:hypothetical protein
LKKGVIKMMNINQGMSSGWFPCEHTETWLENEEVVTENDKAHFARQDDCGKCGVRMACSKCDYSKKVERKDVKAMKKCPTCGSDLFVFQHEGIWDPKCNKFYCFDCIKISDVRYGDTKKFTENWTKEDEEKWCEMLDHIDEYPKAFQSFINRIKDDKGYREGTNMSCPEGHVLRKWRLVHAKLT